MRLHSISIVENFIRETFQILILTAIVGYPLPGYQIKIKVMAVPMPVSVTSITTTSTTTGVGAGIAAVDSSEAHFNAATLFAARLTLSKDYDLNASPTLVPSFATQGMNDGSQQYMDDASGSEDYTAAFAKSLLLQHQHQHQNQHQNQHHFQPSSASDILNDPILNMNSDSGSNEIDGETDSTDYVMANEIATIGTTTTTTTSLPASSSISISTQFNKTPNLSSLSLLSTNETEMTVTSLKLSENQNKHTQSNNKIANNNNNNNNNKYGSSSGSGSSNDDDNKDKITVSSISRSNVRNVNNATIATQFQHIGSQRIALKSTTATVAVVAIATSTTAAATNASSNPNSNNNNNNNKSNTRISAKKVESKYILPKPQKTDAPMLNYIFDTYSAANKHHHHDQRYGPHFEDVQRLGQPTNLTVQAGSSIHLNCKISLLQDKTVSWVRRNSMSEGALDLLTVGQTTYTGDKRYKIEFQYPNNWRLKITNVKKDDEAMYECQISTHPPRVIQINLIVNAPKVMIIDEVGDPLQEKYYEIDSTLQLSCVVRNVAMTSSVVYWKHGENTLNYDVTRGGVSVKTDLMDDGANSTLFIAKINKADSGNYTCSISDFQNFTIVVHILNGESFAELHHGGGRTLMAQGLLMNLFFSFFLLMLGFCFQYHPAAPANIFNVHHLYR